MQPEALGRLLLIQSTLDALPDGAAMSAFLGASLSEIPGVSAAALVLSPLPDDPWNEADAPTVPAPPHAASPSLGTPRRGENSLPLRTLTHGYGALRLQVDDPVAVEPYFPFLVNLAHQAARLLENRLAMQWLAASNQRLRAEMAERLRVEAALEENRRRLARAQELAGLGGWEWNPRSGEVAWSPEMFRLLGLDPGSTPPSLKSLLEVVHPEDRGEIEAFFRCPPDGSAPHGDLEYRVRRAQGEERILRCLADVLVNPDGTPERFQGAVMDVTDHRRTEEALESRVRQRTAELERSNARLRQEMAERVVMEEALRRAKETAEQASRSKSDFLANVSHEIRTPLNSVIGMSDLLRETSLTLEQLEYVQAVAAAGDALLGILNDVLDMSRIESGRLELERCPFSLRQLTGTLASLFVQRARRKGLTLLCRVEEGMPDRWLGDVGRLRQILMNLLSNALKFTEQGEISLRVDWDEGGRGLCWRVIDTGIGIPSGKLEGIFDPFVQSDSSISRRYGGTGLGLAICRRLLGMMGGRIEVSSELGRGSRFTIHLPCLEEAAALERDEEDSAAGEVSGAFPGGIAFPAVASTAAPRSAQLTILVAEDSEDNQWLIKRYLAATPHRVEFVADGAAAVAAFMRNGYDLVLMDMQMPEMDGVQATRLIREWERQQGRPPTPVLALTADALLEHEQRSLDAGCNAHLSKPVRKKTLLDAVKQWGAVQGKSAAA
ncbi:MAG: response regulator [Magnetococcales bacterium]|nr:response regulator [Magnetococcales bacterium]